MTGRIAQVIGAALVVLSLADIFLTVLYARSGTSILSERLGRRGWQVFRRLGRVLPVARDLVLALGGPIILLFVLMMWVSMLLIGFALVFWPAMGTSIVAREGPTPTSFVAALYFSGGGLTTATGGDLAPVNSAYRVLVVFESVVGISVFTLTLTFLTQVYNALQRRNTLALTLHHGTNRTGDAAQYIAGVGARDDFSQARAELAKVANEWLDVYESHHFHPSLLYFRFRDPHYAMSRMALIVLETATLLRAALDDEAHAALKNSSAVSQLWGGGLHLIGELAHDFLPASFRPTDRQPDEHTVARWKHKYRDSISRLRECGIRTTRDEQAGAEEYVSLRNEWDAYVMAFGRYMGHTDEQIDPAVMRSR